MSNDPALDTFLAESCELLGVMESVLLSCEQGDANPEAVNELFRAAHTIKGSAGLFGLDAIVAFTHVVESVLDRVRTDRLSIGPRLVPPFPFSRSLVLGFGRYLRRFIAAISSRGGDRSIGNSSDP